MYLKYAVKKVKKNKKLFLSFSCKTHNFIISGNYKWQRAK